MRASNRLISMTIAFVCALSWFFAMNTVFAETCVCDPPCSGSRTCPDGCWAFCEERKSGPYCAKGCVYESASLTNGDTLSAQSKLNRVDIKMPAEHIKPLLERLFGTSLVSAPAPSKSVKAAAASTDYVVITLKDTDLKGVLDALNNEGISLKAKTPQK